MRKVLLISYHFPPDSAIGAVRAAKFAKYLPEFGWEPLVLTVKERYYDSCDNARMDRDLKRVATYRSSILPGPLQLYSMLRGLHKNAAAPAAPFAPGENGRTMTGREKRFKKFVGSLLRLPDPYQGWILTIAARGRAILRENGADVFVTSGPPMSTHLGGLLLKKMSGARWIADFRDPWMTDLGLLDRTFRSDFVDGLEKRLELKVAQAADRIVATAPGVAQYFCSLLSEEEKEKPVIITNGHDESDFAALPVFKSGSSRTRICHAGALYFNRNPEPLFLTLSDLLSNGEIEGNDLEIEFIGDPTFNGCKLSDLVARHSLEEVVSLPGKMPFDECFKRQMQSDALLLFAQGQPHAIPGKVFEYLRMNKPILAIADEGDTKDLLGSFPHCFIANPRNGGEMGKKLLELIRTVRGNGNGKAILNHISQYDRRNLTGELASILEDGRAQRRSPNFIQVERLAASR